MHAEAVAVREASTRNHARLLGWGGVTLATVVLAYLALDDITTDNAVRFPVEYGVLALCGAWLLFVAWGLVRSGARALAAMSVVTVAIAACVAFDGIGHKRDGGWGVFWPEYLVMAGALLWTIVLAITLLRRGSRAT
jgi:hypothetical protein